MILDIVKYGDANDHILLTNSVDVTRKTPHLNTLIDDMFETLKSTHYGSGLAAPQIGMNLNLFIIKFISFKKVFINPEIELDGNIYKSLEGCLSVKNSTYTVNRYEKVKIKYYDENWVLKNEDYSNNIGRIIQHEYDHLIGKLINKQVTE